MRIFTPNKTHHAVCAVPVLCALSAVPVAMAVRLSVATASPVCCGSVCCGFRIRPVKRSKCYRLVLCCPRYPKRLERKSANDRA